MRQRRPRWILTSGVAAIAVVGLLWAYFARPPDPSPVVSELELPEGVIPLPTSAGVNLDISPDGSRVAFVGISLDRSTHLWERRVADSAFVRLPGTEAARNPTYSPDGRSIAFTRAGRLLTLALAGGSPPVEVAQSVAAGGGIDWGPDGLLYYLRSGEGWSKVLPAGGTPESVPLLRGSGSGLIDVLPGGGILFTRDAGGPLEDQLGLARPSGGSVGFYGFAAMVRYAGSGHLVYTLGNGTLGGRPFDVDALRTTGGPHTLFPGVHVDLNSASYFAVSSVDGGEEPTAVNGSLVYLTAGAIAEHSSELVWIDRSGREAPLDPSIAPAPYTTLALSPDGGRLAVSIASREQWDLWVIDLPSGRRARLTDDPDFDRYPSWSPDGGSVAYTSTLSGRAQARSIPSDGGLAGGSTMLFDRGRSVLGVAFAPDGRLVFSEAAAGTQYLAWVDPNTSTMASFGTTEDREWAPTVSPDGRWLAYVSNVTGRSEVFVRPFRSGAGPTTRISDEGGEEPAWAHNRPELFYREPSTGFLVAVSYGTPSGFVVEGRERLFDARAYRREAGWRAYDVATLDDRFLMMRPTTDAERSTSMRVVQNFYTQLDEEVGRGRSRLLFRFLVIGGLLLITLGVAYATNRWVFGLTSREGIRRAFMVVAFMAAVTLVFGPLVMLEEPVQGIVRNVFAVAVTVGGAWAWLHTRRRIAGAGPIMLEVADLGMRRYAIPAALLGVIAAVNTGFTPDGSVLGRVYGVGVALIVAVAGLRGRSATLAFRERGIVSFTGFQGWEKIQDFGWSPGARATLTLTLSSRFPLFRRGFHRIAPDSREAVSQLLSERLRAHDEHSASTATAVEAPT